MFLWYSLKLETTSKLGSLSLAKVAQLPQRASRVSSRPCLERLVTSSVWVMFQELPSLVPPVSLLHKKRRTLCVCVCVFCPVHSSIKLGDDESRIFPPTVKVMGPHYPGQGWVRARAIDASSPCTDRAPIIANACYVLREGRIYSKGLLFRH